MRAVIGVIACVLATACASSARDEVEHWNAISRHGPACGVTDDNLYRMTEAQQKLAIACIQARMRAEDATRMKSEAESRAAQNNPMNPACKLQCLLRYSLETCERKCAF